MPNETKTTGDWAGAPKRIAEYVKALRERIEKATLQNAVGLVGAIKDGIMNGAPGGQKLAPLHPFTLSQRTGGGGGAKPLFNHGDLVGSVTHKINADKISAVVGLNRSAKNSEGVPVIKIGRIMTEGRIIEVTPKMRAYLHSQGMHLKASTTHIIIPPRPFVRPAYLAYKPIMIERYRKAVEGK